jgi:hypothetical protein
VRYPIFFLAREPTFFAADPKIDGTEPVIPPGLVLVSVLRGRRRRIVKVAARPSRYCFALTVQCNDPVERVEAMERRGAPSAGDTPASTGVVHRDWRFDGRIAFVFGEADPPGCSREVERVVLNALSISRLPHFFADNRGLRIVI